jgi:hypothetical protein
MVKRTSCYRSPKAPAYVGVQCASAISLGDPATAALLLPADCRQEFVDLDQQAQGELTAPEERAWMQRASMLAWRAGADKWMTGVLEGLAREPTAIGSLPP